MSCGLLLGDPGDRLPTRREVRRYYEAHHATDGSPEVVVSSWERRLVRRLGVQSGHEVLDIGCGRGSWLAAVAETGARAVGVDIAWNAAKGGRDPGPRLLLGWAEQLPLATACFDLVTCLGSLEHFLQPGRALEEMLRVARRGAGFLFLVPNGHFLGRRLGVFRGTAQVEVLERSRSLEGWEGWLAAQGLEVVERWGDLHPLAWDWIQAASGSPGKARRMFAALSLLVLPLRWQYQLLLRCRRDDSGRVPAPQRGSSGPRGRLAGTVDGGA